MLTLFALFNNLKKFAILIFSFLCVMLIGINRKLKKNNEILETKIENKDKIIKIQKKILDVNEKNSKSTTLSEFIKRMQNNKF